MRISGLGRSDDFKKIGGYRLVSLFGGDNPTQGGGLPAERHRSTTSRNGEELNCITLSWKEKWMLDQV